MFCGLPIKVAAEPALLAAASVAERPPPMPTGIASKAAVPRRLSAIVRAQRFDERRFGELSRDDRHRKQKRDGRQIDIAAEIVRSHLAACQQHDPGAVDLQPRDPPGGHAGIRQDQEKKDDRSVHREEGADPRTLASGGR